MTVLTNMFGLDRFSVNTGFGLVRFHCIAFITTKTSLLTIETIQKVSDTN